VAQSIIAFYTNLRQPDFDRFDDEGRPMPPTMALRYGSTLAAWEALQLQARGNQQKWKRNLYAAVQRDGYNPTWTEAEWNGRAAIGPPEAPFLDYAPTPQPDRPQAFTAAWRAGDTQPDIPEGMLDRLAASPQDDRQLSRDRRAVPGWDVEESELRVYGHEDGGNCWFAVPCEHCANSSIYAGRGGGARANSVVLRTVTGTREFRAAAASGRGGAVQIDKTGVQEEGFEGLEDMFQ
jgi:hypothetical protein